MGNLGHVAVGDTLILYEDRRDPVEVVVSRVGRTYLYVRRYGATEMRFRRSDGVAPSGHGSSPCVRTPAQEAEAEHRSSLLRNISALGLEPAGYGRCTIATEALERVLSALQGGDTP